MIVDGVSWGFTLEIRTGLIDSHQNGWKTGFNF